MFCLLVWFCGDPVRKDNNYILKGQPLWRACLLVLCAALFMGSFAGHAHAGKAVDRLDAFFSAKGALSADFVQMVQGATFSQPKESRGTLMMQRPGRFRWDYHTPYQQLILADGKRLWIYDQDLAQVVVKPLDAALGNTPALLLSSEGLSSDSLGQNFITTELNDPVDGLYWVQLLPRAKESSFQEMRLGFGEKHISRMILVDGFGQRTELIFSNVKTNAKLPADSFIFVPPEGVDVIGREEMKGKR